MGHEIDMLHKIEPKNVLKDTFVSPHFPLKFSDYLAMLPVQLYSVSVH
ncbi:hypothetical protein VIBNIAM115_1050013 [Vibrio nigripulchritudo AM115]|nr:hypothetical protein VIBNIAM115_1050013 [Vibrio nigripulchritudo AM115]